MAGRERNQSLSQRVKKLRPMEQGPDCIFVEERKHSSYVTGKKRFKNEKCEPMREIKLSNITSESRDETDGCRVSLHPSDSLRQSSWYWVPIDGSADWSHHFPPASGLHAAAASLDHPNAVAAFFTLAAVAWRNATFPVQAPDPHNKSE